jgi:flagellar transcriptional activator FlhD
MVTITVDEEIQELNLTYLLLAQRLIREDRQSALLRLKIDAGIADILDSLSAKQLAQLANTNQLICRPCFDNAEQLTVLVNNERQRGLSETHAALLLASAPRSGLDDTRGD